MKQKVCEQVKRRMFNLFGISLVALCLPRFAVAGPGDTYYCVTNNGIAYSFRVNGGKAVVEAFDTDQGICQAAIDTATPGVLTIPSELGGYPVASIGENAFNECGLLDAVNIPESVTNVGMGAFSGCYAITAVTIPPCVKSLLDVFPDVYQSITNVSFAGTWRNIGDSTFAECEALLSIEIPESVTNIGKYAFGGCGKILSLTIPGQVSHIGADAFSGCIGLTSVTIPTNVTSIGTGAFSDCTGITSLQVAPCVKSLLDVFPSSNENVKRVTFLGTWTTIGDNALLDFNVLTSITIPSTVTNIGDYAFSGCASLTSIRIPEKVENIGEGAFNGCMNLETVNIPDRVANIGKDAFFDTTIYENAEEGLFYVGRWLCGYKDTTPGGDYEVPEGTRGIAGYAFERCEEMSSVSIPGSVLHVCPRAFYGCSELKRITVDAGNPAYCDEDGVLYSKTMTALVFCPQGMTVGGMDVAFGVETVNAFAFEGCTNVVSVMLPETVAGVGKGAFADCANLAEVVFKGNAPSAGEGIYDGTPETMTTFVGAGSTGWNGKAGDAAIPATWQGRPLATVPMMKITLDANGGTSTWSQATVVYGHAIGSLPRATRPMFRLGGWWTAPDGGERVTPQTMVESMTPFTLYAHWVKSILAENDPLDGGALADKGTFAGLLYSDETVGTQTVTAVKGLLTFKVSSLKGKTSARITLRNKRLSLSSSKWDSRDADGTYHATLAARSGERLALSVYEDRVSGTFSGGSVEGTLFCEGARNRFEDKKDAGAQAALASFLGTYTFALPMRDAALGGDVDAVPEATGFFALSVKAKGAVRITGALADGTTLSTSATLLDFGLKKGEMAVPVLVPLYSKKGWFGAMIWIRPNGTAYLETDCGWQGIWGKPGKGRDAFTAILGLEGCRYDSWNVPPNMAFRVSGTPQYWNGGTAIDAVSTALPVGLPVVFDGLRLSVPKATTPKKKAGKTYTYNGPTDANLKLTFSPGTGIFKGTFKVYYDTSTLHKSLGVSVKGVLLSSGGAGFGLEKEMEPTLKQFRGKHPLDIKMQ